MTIQIAALLVFGGFYGLLMFMAGTLYGSDKECFPLKFIPLVYMFISILNLLNECFK